MSASGVGYYREPTVCGDQVVFVCESDLWSVSLEGGLARRLTANYVDVRSPALSPDGKWLALVGRDEGVSEVYVMPAAGGPMARRTYQGDYCLVTGWTADSSKIRYVSQTEQAPRHGSRPWVVPCESGPPELVDLGPADRLVEGPKGGLLLGRNIGDPSRWKRYRGGRTGYFWIDRAGEGTFEALPTFGGNLTDPMWIKKRIYFLSDHEGHGNLYSVDLRGGKLARHTHHEDFYARNAKSDGKSIVYQCGAELWVFSVASGETRKLEVEVASSKQKLQRKFASATPYLESADVHPKSHSLALGVRGKPFVLGNWEGQVRQLGERHGVRYRMTHWLHDGEALVTLSDAEGEEALEIHRLPPPDPERARDASTKDKKPGQAKDKKAEDKKKKKKDKKKKGKQEEPPKPLLERLGDLDIGRPLLLAVSPTKNAVVIANQRLEVLHVDLDTKTLKVLDRSDYGRILGVGWSPDGRYVTYGFRGSPRTSHIRVTEVETGEVREVTSPVHLDAAPAFDPKGRYLYFVSYRTFNPVYDRFYFDLGFPEGGKVYLVTLQKDTPSPLRLKPRSLHGDDDDDDKKDDDDAKGKKKKDKKKDKKKSKNKDDAEADGAQEAAKAPAGEVTKEGKKAKGEKKGKKAKGEKKDTDAVKPIKIDFEGITERVLALPVQEGIYGHVDATEDKVFFDRWPIQGTLDEAEEGEEEEPEGTLYTFDLKTLEEEHYASGIGSWGLALDRKTLIYASAAKLRVVAAGSKPEGEGVNRKGGWIDLGRVRVAIQPAAEWRQMYRELWRLQRDNFWTADMSGVDWEDVYQRYLPVLARVATRTEFSDLAWEVQGELGTSHAYEWGGDHRRGPRYPLGHLGADLRWGGEAWEIARIPRGDGWNPEASSPLSEPGLDVRPGDKLLEVEGQALSAERTPGEALLHKADTEVELRLQRGAEPPRRVVVTTLEGEEALRYRDWVEANRARVHEDSKGQVGYVHVPNMGPVGFAEFHRYYLAEFNRPGLIVDVRRNGGGHVSQLLLEKLARRRIGYDVPRYGKPVPYPEDARLGPVVCLTDEHAGSDGDIFSHCFKLLGLGPLIGKRTWGGVIGIWPRHPLVDRSITTQAEFAFWFTDVGWRVENYGTEPDIEVEVTPQDWAAGLDPQLAKGLEVVSGLIAEEKPAVPDFGPRPQLRAPRLTQA